MPRNPASTLPEALEGREIKPLCAPGESEPSKALGIAMIVAGLDIVGLAIAVMVWAT